MPEEKCAICHGAGVHIIETHVSFHFAVAGRQYLWRERADAITFQYTLTAAPRKYYEDDFPVKQMSEMGKAQFVKLRGLLKWVIQRAHAVVTGL